MPNNSTRLLAIVTRRLFFTLLPLLAICLALAAFVSHKAYIVTALVIGAGSIGGFVGLQRRLKDLTEDDLELLATSWFHTSLSPLVGSVLALLMYILFLSGLLSGSLFPSFIADDSGTQDGFLSIANQHARDGFSGYAKLLFWSFVAGFSEHFVTDVIGRFEGEAIKFKSPTPNSDPNE
nr:hypothetical protein [uncultured Cupriavidus sp.]